MRTAKDPRHLARIIAAMELYNYFFDTETDNRKFNPDSLEFGNYSKKLMRHLYDNVIAKQEEIDSIIDSHSDPIKVSDLDTLSLQIIRIAILEGFLERFTPPKVAVDEAIELIKDFGSENYKRKVSGILGKIFEKMAESETPK